MSEERQLSEISDIERQVLSFFADAVRVLGLPKSVGEIYALLFISKVPLSLDSLVLKLNISKGSGSQGLKMLRALGAVKESAIQEGRKTYYEADAELKSLVGGFIKHKVRPHLESAGTKISEMRELEDYEDKFYHDKVEKLNKWRKRAGMVLPILQKILGK